MPAINFFNKHSSVYSLQICLSFRKGKVVVVAKAMYCFVDCYQQQLLMSLVKRY